MKQKYLIAIATVLTVNLIVSTAFAGNKQRAGQAGAAELLINPWARSSGFGNANVASVTGLEGIFLNVAGTAFTKQLELAFVNTNWLKGTDIALNAFGFSQKVGEAGVLSMSVLAMNFGDIDITTPDKPDGGIGTFSPRYTNISIAYAKMFSNSIYGGAVIKIINEATSDIHASGVAFDAGIQYVTGEREQIKFGVTMQNVGPTMRFKGDGLSFRGNYVDGPIMTVESRSADFELPSLVRIGFSYDFAFLAETQFLTLAANFTSNSFTKDQYHAGFEYSYKKLLFLRAGYIYEEGITTKTDRSTCFTGPTFGMSVQVPLDKKKGSVFAVEYSYRDTDPFQGVHSIGARITM